MVSSNVRGSEIQSRPAEELAALLSLSGAERSWCRPARPGAFPSQLSGEPPAPPLPGFLGRAWRYHEDTVGLSESGLPLDDSRASCGFFYFVWSTLTLFLISRKWYRLGPAEQRKHIRHLLGRPWFQMVSVWPLKFLLHTRWTPRCHGCLRLSLLGRRPLLCCWGCFSSSPSNSPLLPPLLPLLLWHLLLLLFFMFMSGPLRGKRIMIESESSVNQKYLSPVPRTVSQWTLVTAVWLKYLEVY